MRKLRSIYILRTGNHNYRVSNKKVVISLLVAGFELVGKVVR